MTALSNTTGTTRRKKSRRELPKDLTDFYIVDGDRPSALDVIAGRGSFSNQHPGNKRYWHLILADRPIYKKLGTNDKTEKNNIAQSIYNYVLSTGGRFLQLDRENQKWFNLPQKIGLEKIKQALRDKYVPNSLGPLSAMAAPLPKISIPPSEGDKKQFLAFLNNKAPVVVPPPKRNDFISSSSTSSIDLSSILGQDSLERIENVLMPKPLDEIKDDDAWTTFATQNDSILKSFEFNLRGHSLDNQQLSHQDCKNNNSRSISSKRKRKRETTNDDLDVIVASNQFVSKKIRTLTGAIERHGKAMGDLQLELLMNKMNSEILNELKKETIVFPSLSQ